MSTIATSAHSGQQTASAAANSLIAAVILGLFVLACALSAAHKDVTQGFDEMAHVSYVAEIQRNGGRWPALESLRLLDPQTFQFTAKANYLNHPPMFYALLAAIGPTLEGHPQALLAHRLFDVALVSIGLTALLALGLAAPFSRLEFYAYAVPLACIPALAPLGGAVNNDDLAFLGGTVATLAVWQLVATGRGIWLLVALAGVVTAGWAKLTGLLLTGAMLGAVLAYLLWRRRLRWTWAIAALFAFALAAVPYVVYVIHYGSPTPNTPAQIALIADNARAAGWTELPRKSFPGYLIYFAVEFVADWMPTLGDRSLFNHAMLIVPAAAVVCALAGFALSLRRLWRREETALDIAVACGALAIAATLALHVSYSYERHVATGWLMDAYPRYYLPLAAIVPLAGLSLAAGITAPRRRAALLAFLVAGPIVFGIFGAPLGWSWHGV